MGTNNVLHTTYDRGQIFIKGVRTDKGTYTNGGGAPVTIAEGTILGRVTATGKLLPLKSTATDGSQIPVGICFQAVTVAAGDDAELTYCIAGDVTENRVVFALGGDTLNTIIYQNLSSPVSDQIALGRLGDLIQRNTHIILVATTENTEYDNTAS